MYRIINIDKSIDKVVTDVNRYTTRYCISIGYLCLLMHQCTNNSSNNNNLKGCRTSALAVLFHHVAAATCSAAEVPAHN